jgi:hypothetical protein
MLGFGNTSVAPDSANVPCNRDARIYDRYASGLYRQALLTLDDAQLAEQVVCDVLVEECMCPREPGTDEENASYRLAVSAYWHCREVADDPARQQRRPGRRPSGRVVGCVDPGGLLSEKERAGLGLVLFGGLECIQASRVLAISPSDMAALMRAVLRRLQLHRADDGMQRSSQSAGCQLRRGRNGSGYGPGGGRSRT